MTALFGNIIRLVPLVVFATGAISASAQQPAMHHLNVAFKDVMWQKMVPELGDRSPEIAILRVESNTHATQLMIRVPKNTHVPRHWHSANETHTIVSGTFIIECEGQRAELGLGSFNYIPRKLPHEAWTKPDVGALLFITVDGPWDVNWVNGPPKPEDFIQRGSN
jgi:mannose-6-phosphate isomerase-like protein (cupin superfamily)